MTRILEIDSIAKSDLNQTQVISGEFLASPLVNDAECWLAPRGGNEVDESWILLGNQTTFDFLSPRLEPLGGGNFLYAHFGTAKGLLWIEGNRLKLSLEVLELDDDGDTIKLEVPVEFRLQPNS